MLLLDLVEELFVKSLILSGKCRAEDRLGAPLSKSQPDGQKKSYLDSPAAMSSMRNATQRRNHRERGQPLEREARLGILEKHKVRTSMLLGSWARFVTQDIGLLAQKQKSQ